MIPGVNAAAQGTGTIPGMAGQTGVEMTIGITEAIVTQATRAMRPIEGTAVIHLIVNGAGMTIVIILPLKVHPCCPSLCFYQESLDAREY